MTSRRPGPVRDMSRLADPAGIRRALVYSQSLPSDGWFVLDASRTMRSASGAMARSHVIDDVELVAWTTRQGLFVAPATCPHMGADLSRGTIDPSGCLVCPWHGLRLDPHSEKQPSTAGAGWIPWRVHDDGILVWVQPPQSLLSGNPNIPLRPTGGIAAVIRREAACEPVDVIANRLDPWHGPSYHPYAFSWLDVVSHDETQLTMRVAYRMARRAPERFDVTVTAQFRCTGPRSITMTIIEGEGTGSVVETHATPARPYRPELAQLPQTTIIEATIATSERSGFATAERAAALMRPIMRRMASQLWRDDATYAERLFTLRCRDGSASID